MRKGVLAELPLNPYALAGMRFLLGLIALLLLPVFVFAHWRFYQRMMKPALEVRLHQMMTVDPALAHVDVKIDQMDVILDGQVPDLAARERATTHVRKLAMLRFRPEDNHIEVPSSLESKLEGERLTLRGLLHDETAVHDIVQWLKDSRPSLQVDTTTLQISPYATREQFKERSPLPDMLRPIWSQITVASALKIARQDHQFAVSGYLPTPEWVEQVAAALKTADPQAQIDRRGMKTGLFVKPVGFTQPKELPTFLQLYFSLPDSASFEASQSLIHFSANVTKAMYDEWKPVLDKLAGDGTQVEADWHYFPSIFHLPSYQVQAQAQMDPEALMELQQTLADLHIHFAFSSVSVAGSEEPKIKEAAQAILGAGPNVRVVVGAYFESLGDDKTSESQCQKRAEAVIQSLAARGLPAARQEPAIFYYPPGVKPAPDEERMIELRVK